MKNDDPGNSPLFQFDDRSLYTIKELREKGAVVPTDEVLEIMAKAHLAIIQSLCIPAEILQGDSNYSSARFDAKLFPQKKPVESRALIVRQ